MSEYEKFFNEYMIAFDENGLSCPDPIMFMRARQVLKELKELKSESLKQQYVKRT